MNRPARTPAPASDSDELRKDYLRERIRAETAERTLGQIVKFLYRDGAAQRLCQIAREQFQAPPRATGVPAALEIEPFPREVRDALDEWRRRRDAARIAYAALPDVKRRDLPAPALSRDCH